MRARVVLAGAAVVLSVTLSACGGSDGAAAGPGAPAADCSASAAPTPAKGITQPLGEVILDSTDPSCATATISVSATAMTPGGAQVAVGETVAFVFTADAPAFRVGLEAPHPVSAGTTLIYRFGSDNRYYATLSGAIAGEISVGNPTGVPAPSAKPSDSTIPGVS